MFLLAQHLLKTCQCNHPTTARPNMYNIIPHPSSGYMPCDVHICIACLCSRARLPNAVHPALLGVPKMGGVVLNLPYLAASYGHGVIVACDCYTAAVLTAMERF